MTDTHQATGRRPISRECMVDACELCTGYAAPIYAEGAAYTDAPIATPPCGCTRCGHPGARR